MSWPAGKATGLEGIVPDVWLRRERWLRETDQVMVILHPEPTALGHCIIFPKKHSPRMEECDPDLLSAVGMVMPEVKRAIRLITGYRDYGIILRSGKTAGQNLDHIYFELVPTIHTKPAFSINWDPNNRKGKGQNDAITKKATHSLVSMLRREMGLHHFDGFGCVLLETERITVEFVDVPISTGHMIISPKEISPDLEDCDPVDFAACLFQLPKLTRSLRRSMNLENFFVIILNGPAAGQKLAHLVIQLVPCSGRGPSVIFEQHFFLKPSTQTERNMVHAIKQILGHEIVTLALGQISAPRESAWSRPISREGTNPAGTASPALIRARSLYPSIDTWAMSADTQAIFKRPDSQGSMHSFSGSHVSSLPPSRLATPGSLPSLPNSRSNTPGGDYRPRGGVFQRSAQQSMGNTGMTGMIMQQRPSSRLSVMSGVSSQDSAESSRQAGESRAQRKKSNILNDLDSLLQS